MTNSGFSRFPRDEDGKTGSDAALRLRAHGGRQEKAGLVVVLCLSRSEEKLDWAQANRDTIVICRGAVRVTGWPEARGPTCLRCSRG
jgi:hypothetical protein